MGHEHSCSGQQNELGSSQRQICEETVAEESLPLEKLDVQMEGCHQIWVGTVWRLVILSFGGEVSRCHGEQASLQLCWPRAQDQRYRV